jgi:hypothetical protein
MISEDDDAITSALGYGKTMNGSVYWLMIEINA